MAARSTAIPPPVGGWNANDALADMPADHAYILDNWFPETDRVTLRRGSAEHADGMSGGVDTLLEYTNTDGDGELFAANGGSIYDVSSSGTVGSAVASGFTSDRWQQVQIGTSGGHFLLAVNGQDTPQTYDGSSWADATMTGPTVDSLVWCNLHQRRLWFGEVDSLTAWYLAVNSITGAASSFDLSAVARLGGYIMAMGTWTRDSGEGADDVAVFITSEGEAILYVGTDPSTASTWNLIGTFRIGKPLGRRCIIKAGADLVLMTQDGFVPASRILSMDRSQTALVAISQQINKAVNDAIQDFQNTFGWQPILYPKAAQLIFNVPAPNSQFHQYVFNTITRAPCRFTGMNARCWGSLNGDLYFGTADGRVMQADTGTDDDGSDIDGDALQAFNYFGSRNRDKAFKRVETIFQSADDPAAAIDVYTDFDISSPTGTPSPGLTNAALWGISEWGVGTWGSVAQIWKGWRGVRGTGRAAAIRVRVRSGTNRPSWIATNWLFTDGGKL